MIGENCDSLKQDNEYLRDEIERRDREEWERADREYEERQRRRKEREREYQESLCSADSWEEAFGKAIIRFSAEARMEQQEIAKYGKESADELAYTLDTYFTDELKIVERARALYNEAMAEAAAEIEKLKQQARERAADKLAAEFPETSIAEALRKDDYSSLINW